MLTVIMVTTTTNINQISNPHVIPELLSVGGNLFALWLVGGDLIDEEN